eukprot:TRINITY_DN9270_c0_g1_i2.p1 TRINITY_DN9270_c0_g1~~TRINITY_DN9270_c0_g1_i2.p1  ORF type:complete len:159 (-),score=7.41 TRINITY_DN9270_c0_g1_i2:62-538(-)
MKDNFKIQKLFGKRIEHLDAKMNEENFTKNEKYLRFQREVWSVKHPGEPFPDEFIGDELVVSTQDKDTIPKDPFTQEEISDPVKNVNCGHVYSKKQIFSSLSTTRARSIKCPLPGCSQLITKESLKDDKETLKNIERIKKLRAKGIRPGADDEEVVDV